MRIPGADYTLSSDGFFQLAQLPRRVAIVGAGYIAVELAGMLRGLGAEVALLIRHDRPLRTFDETVATVLEEEMEASGVEVHKYTEVCIRGCVLPMYCACFACSINRLPSPHTSTTTFRSRPSRRRYPPTTPASPKRPTTTASP